MATADGPYATPADRLATFFDDDPAQSREIYQDTEIDQIANLLEQIAHVGFRCPRTYIVLRTIGGLDVLERLLNEGFTDQWFPVELRGLPSFLSPSVKSRIVQSQGIVLTKSLDIENGRHRHFMPGETLPFEILGRLGSGGYGQVDRIVSKISFRQFALKRIRRRAAFGNNSKVAMKQFMSEIHIVKSLEHRHTVQYIGSYTDKTFLGLIMAPVADTDLASFMGQTCMYIQATTLASDESSVLRLRNQALASEMCSTLRTYFGCLAAALAYLHDRSIRHKDIKPQNILVHKGNVLLTDFGLSRDFTDDVGSTTSGITPASPRYSPPEVAMYEARNTSADIWSLGCVYLEMLAALHGYNTDWIKRYFAGVHTQATHFHANPDATSQLLQEWEATWTMLDKMPLLWTKEMLRMERQLRPTAARVFELVTSIDDSNQSSTNFCGICCILDDETDSNDSLVDDPTILAEPHSARVRADLQSTSLGQTHDATTTIPAWQRDSSNTQSDETDRFRQFLALSSVTQPVQSASSGENTQLNQNTNPEPAKKVVLSGLFERRREEQEEERETKKQQVKSLPGSSSDLIDEATRRAKTPDLSVEGAITDRNAATNGTDHDHEHQRVRTMMTEDSAPVDDSVSITEEEQPVEELVSVISIDSTKRPATSSHGKSEVFDNGANANDIAENVAGKYFPPVRRRPLASENIIAQSRGGSSGSIAEIPDDSELFPNSSKPNTGVLDAKHSFLSDSTIMDRPRGTYHTPFQTETATRLPSYPISESSRAILQASPAYTDHNKGRQSFVIKAYDEPMTKSTSKKRAEGSGIDMSNISSSVDGPASQRSSPTNSRSSSPTSKTRFNQDSGPRSSPAPRQEAGQRGVIRYFANLKKKFVEPKKESRK
jgi:serine/threonine protein kinase